MSSVLFDELVLSSGVRLPNRFVMGSMHLGWEEFPGGHEILADFYGKRAAAGVGMIITGGIAPNEEGAVMKGGAVFNSSEQIPWHQHICEAIHKYSTKICLQILHTGRYALNPANVGPSALRAPINPFVPKALDEDEIERTIQDFVNTAVLAQQAGYDGVEIMGSEGYLLNQFSVPRTNKREDQWGGSIENRIRLSTEIVRRTREAVGDKFVVIFRLSMLDLVEGGNTWDEIVFHAHALKEAGVDILNTGIGWHEARIPTIAGVVPENGFLWVTDRMKKAIDMPIIATNRFNHYDGAVEAVQEKKADLISMARPFLADAEIVDKFSKSQFSKVNTCIACNQACLDHIFQAKAASCLVNPEAGMIQSKNVRDSGENGHSKNIIVVGGGPAGLSFAFHASRRGHQVKLLEKGSELGGQFLLARQVPGKKVYNETIKYFKQGMDDHGAEVHLNTSFDLNWCRENTDVVVWAAGVAPRTPIIMGVDSSYVKTYDEVLAAKEIPKVKNIAIIGGGGISVDLAHYLYHDPEEDFYDFWGIDKAYHSAGGLKEPVRSAPEKNITIFKRSKGKIGGSLGKTTGWIHRLYLKEKGIRIVEGVQYKCIEESVLVYEHQEAEVREQFDLIILCAGQESVSWDEGVPDGIDFHIIGGARKAQELDAQKAIEEAYELALKI